MEHRLAEGDAATETLRLALVEQCDVIVMGTRGKSGLGRLLIGSVAEEVLREATCQVLVVKIRARRPPGPIQKSSPIRVN